MFFSAPTRVSGTTRNKMSESNSSQRSTAAQPEPASLIGSPPDHEALKATKPGASVSTSSADVAAEQSSETQQAPEDHPNVHRPGSEDIPVLWVSERHGALCLYVI